MALRDFFAGRDVLSTAQEISSFVGRSRAFDAASEDLAKAEVLLLFRTPRQQTWLVTTERRLYCVLDDKAKSQPELRWTLAKADLLDGGSLKLQIEPRDHSERVGLISFGSRHKDWYFSKDLFSGLQVRDAISDLILKKMV